MDVCGISRQETAAPRKFFGVAGVYFIGRIPADFFYSQRSLKQVRYLCFDLVVGDFLVGLDIVFGDVADEAPVIFALHRDNQHKRFFPESDVHCAGFGLVVRVNIGYVEQPRIGAAGKPQVEQMPHRATGPIEVARLDGLAFAGSGDSCNGHAGFILTEGFNSGLPPNGFALLPQVVVEQVFGFTLLVHQRKRKRAESLTDVIKRYPRPDAATVQQDQLLYPLALFNRFVGQPKLVKNFQCSGVNNQGFRQLGRAFLFIDDDKVDAVAK